MAKPTHFETVTDWVKSEYSVTKGDAGNLSEATLSKVGQVLRTVHPNSPAGLLGLQAGDILHALNGGVFDEMDLKKTFQPRRFGRSYSFDLLRPSTREKIRIKGKTFPFGAQYGQTVDSFVVSLRNGDPDPHDISGFWKYGPDGALAELWPAFEAYNLRLLQLNGAPYDGAFPKFVPPTAPLAGEDVIWPGAFAWLALCAAYAGEWDRAQHVLGLVNDHFDRSGDSGMMDMFAAMAFTRSMIAENKGYKDNALAHLDHAIEMSPETEVLYRHRSQLSQEASSPPPSPFIGRSLDYVLPKTDPTQKFSQSGKDVSFQDTVSGLKPGDLILVCLMSGYRTNGPYVEGFQRAHIPLSRLKARFKAVHIITSWDASRSRDLPWPVMEPTLEKSGVNISVLFDQEDTVSDNIGILGAPTNLVIDHTGTIIADGWLAGDEILWDGLGTAESS